MNQTYNQELTRLETNINKNLENLSTLTQNYEGTDNELVKLIRRVDLDHDDRIKRNIKNISDNTNSIKRNFDRNKSISYTLFDNIENKQKEQDLNIKKIQESLDRKINTNSGNITSNKNSIENNTRLTRNLFTSVSNEQKQQDLNIKKMQESLNNEIKTNSNKIRDIEKESGSIRDDVRRNSASIENIDSEIETIKNTNERRNTESERNERKFKSDIDSQLRGLRSAIAFNSMNMQEMDEELQKQKLINLATMSQLAKLKKNPFFHLKI